MATKTDDPPKSSAVRANFTHEGRVYESRLVLCGKRNCTKCFPPGGMPRPSHGPYWYLCGQRRGRWSRLYLGRQLDTQKFVAADGSIDWDNAKRPHSIPGRPPGLAATVPGQMDAIDDQTLALPAPTPDSEATS